MNYFEYIEKSHQSMDKYEEVKSNRPKELEDTPEVRDHCINELNARLEMLVDIKNVLRRREIPLRDYQYLAVIPWRNMVLIRETIKALSDNNATSDFEYFLDKVEEADTYMNNLMNRFIKIKKRSSEPFNPSKDYDNYKEGI